MILSANNIKVSFRKEYQTRLFGKERQEILHGVGVQLEHGKCLGLIGESGSGKSTLGKVLCGLLRPDSGQVNLDGVFLYDQVDKEKRDKLKHKISIVFQDYISSVNPRFKVEHIIGESLRAYERVTKQKVDKSKEVIRLLERVGLDESYMGRYPHELSGGQLQRVCIARALAIKPKVILFDEAISSLDAATQTQVMDLLKEIKEAQELSYIFITHDLTAITYLCDEVLFMKDGNIVEHIKRISEITKLKNPYAKKLLQSVMTIDLD